MKPNYNRAPVERDVRHCDELLIGDSGAKNGSSTPYVIKEFGKSLGIFVFLKVLFKCNNPIIRRHLINLKLRNLFMQFQILRLQLGDIMLDRRLSRLEKRFNIR
jgi:hypothetical protein